MSQLKDLMDIPDEIELSNGLKMPIYSITLEDEAKFFEFQQKEEYMKAISFMVTQTIREAFPDASDDEINKLNKEDLKKITDAVMKKNKLEIKDNTEGKN